MFLKTRSLATAFFTSASALLLLAALPAPVHAAGDATNWVFRNPSPSINTLYGATFAQGKFVAVGDYLTILTSANGTVWSPSNFSFPDAFTDVTLESVAGNSSLFVAVGDRPEIENAYGTILTSPDGKTWTSQNSTVQEDLYAVATNGTLFVAVGDYDTYGTIVTSTDGVTWTAQNSTVFEDELNGVAANSTLWVAVGDEGTIATSPNGTTWTSQDSGTSEYLGNVAGNGTLFVAVGDSGTILTSPDGVTWSAQMSDNSNDFSSVIWTGTQFVASDYEDNYYTSPDGVTWTTHEGDDGDNEIDVLASNGNQIVAVGEAYNGAAVETSPDGIDWTERSHDITDDTDLEGVTTFGKSFVAVDNDGAAYTSPDGATWTQYFTDADTLDAVAGNDNLLVAVGGFGFVATSANGTVWDTQNSTVVKATLYAVTWSGSLFVAAGTNSVVVTSPDGVVWTSRNSTISDHLFGLTSNGSLVVAVGANGAIVTSPDGATWTAQNSTVEATLRAVAWNGSVFVAVGNALVTSPDGVTWTGHDQPSESIYSIMSDGSQFVAGDNDGNIYTSPDGVNWTTQPTHTDETLYGVAFNGSTFVAVGQDGLILTSGSAAVAKPAIKTQPVSQTGEVGGKITFSVTATGPGPLTYQWLKNGKNIAGATSSSLTLSNLKTTNAGSYTVIVTNAGGSVTSNSATLKVVSKVVPLYILVQPKPIADKVGAKVTLSVTVNAPATKPITYQWFMGNVPVKNEAGHINGAKTDTLIFKSLQKSDAGTYSVTITNPAGSIKSTTVRVTVRQ